jgi:exopolyphosphatase / guanosine-5'-triphosphate,3'-diphosphate pyrophosphatase
LPDYKAVIDIGTNSFHLIIAEVLSNGKVNTVQRERIVVRLGTEGKEALTHISEKEQGKAIDVLKEFRKLGKFYNAEIFAVATSAVRESDNKEKFLEAVYKETGIKIKVIDGKEEASYIFTGVQNALPMQDQRILCIDIGGGSTEIIIGKNGKSDFLQSYKLGAVRLSKMFFKEYLITQTGIRECSGYISKALNESGLPDFVKDYDAAVGASGTILAISSVVSFNKYGSIPEDLNGFTFTSEELNQAADLILSKTTLEERTTIKGIDKSRAEIIPPGVLILKNIFAILGIDNMTISGYALREGFLLSQIKKES